MEKQRTLEVKVISARYLHKVNFLRKMDVYAVVSISGHPSTKQKTPVDRGGGENPSWNSSSPMRFSVDDVVLGQTMVFNLRCLRTLGDEDVGEVHVPVSDLAASATSGKSQFVTYQVRMPSGKPKGELYFSYRWSDKIDTTAVAPPTDAKFQEPSSCILMWAPLLRTIISLRLQLRRMRLQRSSNILQHPMDTRLTRWRDVGTGTDTRHHLTVDTCTRRRFRRVMCIRRRP